MAQERFNILLPEALKARLQTDAQEQGVSSSKLISQYIAEHYATNDALTRLDVFEKECTTLRERLEQEQAQAAHGLERERAQAAEKTASQDTVINGLQHRLELAETNTKNLSEQVVDLKGQIRDLKDDKQQLQKQLELLTLRLPAPKEGFWVRVFGRRRKEQEAKA